jgi:hypothetical protein
MSELTVFLDLGFRHITDAAALDHLLFLVALAAIYHGREWAGAISVVTAFTVGHSLTLALAATGTVRLPTPWIEFLIPLTILATGLENLIMVDRRAGLAGGRSRALLAGGFGLVHGAGFANALGELFEGSIVRPLLGFNLGIELGQLLVLVATAVLLTAVDRVLAPRRRTVIVSAAVTAVAAGMAWERIPWR